MHMRNFQRESISCVCEWDVRDGWQCVYKNCFVFLMKSALVAIVRAWSLLWALLVSK